MALVQTSFVLGPFATNAYLVSCEETKETAVIDVGFDAEAIAAEIRRLSLTVRYLLNTHAHYDHVAAMADLQALVGGSYWLHPGDQPLLEGLTAQGLAFGLPAARAPQEVHALEGGQTLELGRCTLTVIHTPGHSPGSVTFRWNDCLWVGDLLFAGSIGRTDFPGGSFEILSASIRQRLFPLGDELRVLPGHGPETTIGIERRTNPFVGEGAQYA
jgi:glyoxylase-like metal-dependent hydrolase (beta-lactamase superfamily II)